jgi:hypothetical protein
LERHRLDHGEQVLYPMAELAHEQVLLGLPLVALGGIHHREQQGPADVVGMEQPARGQEHRAPAEAREIVLDLIVQDGAALGDHVFEQTAQLRDVPLSIAKFVEVLPDRLIAADFECVVESPAGRLDTEVPVEDKQRVGDGVDDALGLDVLIPHHAVAQIHEPSRLF